MKVYTKILFLICLVFLVSGCQTSVSILYNDASRQETYAAKALKKALNENGYTVKENGGFQINFAIDTLQLVKEAFTILPEGKNIHITGGDERGLIYGALSLSEDIRNGIALSDCRQKNEKPGSLEFRALKHNLPWDSYRHSFTIDQHMDICRDTTYWEAYLDMMAENRFNVLTIWNLHPFPYMIMPKNYPEASPFTAEEFEEWQTLYKTIFRMAKDRAIETYILWYSIFTTPQFARAHNLPIINEERNHYIQADTSEIVKHYIRESVTQILDEYPDLTGVGPTLAEGMGGMTPEEREAWSIEVLIEGMKQANRTMKYIHRAPASANTVSAGSTSVEAERLTRAVIEKEAEMGFTEGPIWVEFKFNWSHGHSTPKLIKVHGGELTDTYWNPVSDKYKVVWHLRNDDFFCLRWGVPSFARSHVKMNSQPYVGGYFLGAETYIPAKDYFTTDTNVPWKYAFERQWLFYKIWGRLMYNSDTPDEVFQAEMIRRYGENGKNLLEASSLAGSTPLRFASSFDYTWDFTLYSEGMMSLVYRDTRQNPRTGVFYVSVDRFINQPPFDPDYVSVAEYVQAIAEGKSFGSNRTIPPDLAEMLERDCNRALELVKDIKAGNDKALMYEVADIKAWSYLGLHFAEKIRGAVALQTYRTQGGEENKQKAVTHLEKGLQYWDDVIAITRPLYNDMPLVHYSEMDGRRWTYNNHWRFHWALIRPDVANDVVTAKEARVIPFRP